MKMIFNANLIIFVKILNKTDLTKLQNFWGFFVKYINNKIQIKKLIQQKRQEHNFIYISLYSTYQISTKFQMFSVL